MSDDGRYRRRTVLGAAGGLALTTLVGGAATTDRQPAGRDVESVHLERVGRYETGEFDGGAEIVAYDADGSRLFVVNAGAGRVEVLDLSTPGDPERVGSLDAAGDVEDGGGANSVDVVGGLVAVAVEHEDPQRPGSVALYDAASLDLLDAVTVGALPDKVTIAPDGNYVVSANEGEPAFDEEPGERTDPRGSVSVIDVGDGPEDASVSTLTFAAYDDDVERLREEGVRVYGASAEDDDPKPSTDFEPEYVTITPDSTTAFVSLQENNAVATVDIERADITDVSGMGFKDFSLPGNELDTSDVDAGDADDISLQSWPVKGMYQPDAIATYEVGGETYLVTANEGDSRDYEVSTVADLTLDESAFAPRLSENPYVDSVAELQAPENLGTLEVTNQLGDPDGDGEFEDLYLFGARSFSVWKVTGDGLQQVYDSGNDFERLYAEQFPAGFQNSTESGPETESVELGRVGNRTFAFVGIERGSGIFVYDVTAPAGAEHVQTVVNRDFSVGFGDLAADAERNPDADEPGRGGDFSPEGLEFVSASDSPTDTPLLAAGYEVSGTVAVFEVRPVPDGAPGRSDDAGN